MYRPNRVLARLLYLTGLLPLLLSCERDDSDGFAPYDVSVSASEATVTERASSPLILTAEHRYHPDTYQWRQVVGPGVPLMILDERRAEVDLSSFEVALDVELTFEIVGSYGGTSSSARVDVLLTSVDASNALGGHRQIGGASTAAAAFEDSGAQWVSFNFGGTLAVARLDARPEILRYLALPAMIEDIEIVSFGLRRYALLALGTEGIAAVDVTVPSEAAILRRATVNLRIGGVTFTDGGGNIVSDQVIESPAGHVVDLESDGETLWIANAGFGIHRTSLSMLLAPEGPIRESDGTLKIESERCTLQFAGENPWGGPRSLDRVGNRLFVTLGELGLGIFDSESLERVGQYNLYTDAAVEEDWAIDMDVADAVQPDFLDPLTGMPSYEQVQFEIREVWRGGLEAPMPWADFEGQGKYFYTARNVEVIDGPERSIAYLAYGLGGLVAVDVTGYETADSGDGFLEARYLGSVPATPAHGPKKPTGQDGRGSLLARHGVDRLKEAGVVDVFRVGDQVYLADHFGGLVVVDGAEDPEGLWHGPDAPYDNDDPSIGDGTLGDHWPPWEFVTSYDMSPLDEADEESLRRWIAESPCLFATGEMGGHAYRLLPLSPFQPGAAGSSDILQCASAGGIVLVDILDLDAPAPEDRLAVSGSFPTTREVGAGIDGDVPISIGHTNGLAASSRHLYLADGPHGVSAWRIADARGAPIDRPHLVANSFQAEEDEAALHTLAHAHQVVLSADDFIWGVCRSAGLRRLDVSEVEAGRGRRGEPLLLVPRARDVFEHKTEESSVPGIRHQDNARDLAIHGDLAFVADGRNGLTVYDTSKDPTDSESGFFVANVGAGDGKPALGVASGIALLERDGRLYAFLACGPFGLGVVDVTEPADLQLIKVFEPINVFVETEAEHEEEEGHVGTADAVGVDILVTDTLAWISYDSSGVYCYSIDELIAPLPAGMDPTEVWKFEHGELIYDHRPQCLANFRLEETLPEAIGGGALRMSRLAPHERQILLVAYGAVGVAKIDWTRGDAPILLELIPTCGEAESVTVANGRIYVADGSGGVAIFR